LGLKFIHDQKVHKQILDAVLMREIYRGTANAYPRHHYSADKSFRDRLTAGQKTLTLLFFRIIYDLIDMKSIDTIAGSSSGRMQVSETCHEGSNPSPALTKFCGKCKTEKEVSNFGKRGNKLQPWCKPCKNFWDRENYRNNKSQRRTQINTRRNTCIAENREFLKDYFEKHHCVDCGESDLVVLEFDHIYGVKTFNVGEAVVQGFSLEKIKQEIQKCEVVCANCHKRRTSKRGNHWRTKI
jgi:hypothetical protein